MNSLNPHHSTSVSQTCGEKTNTLKERTEKAFLNGRLVVRRVNQGDTRYLNLENDEKNPRPGFNIKFNQRLGVWMEQPLSSLYVGLTGVVPLAIYKCDAGTSSFSYGNTLDTLGCRTLSGFAQFWAKQEELQSRNLSTSCYEPMTSGRLNEENRFTLPKLKPLTALRDENYSPYSETLVSGYDPNNISCIVIIGGTLQKLSPFKIIQQIKRVERMLGLKQSELPIGFYTPEQGKLTLHSQQELFDSIGFKELDQYEEDLAKVRAQFDTPQGQLNQLMEHLSPPDRFRAFLSLNPATVADLKSNTDIKQEFESFLALNSGNPTAEDLDTWIANGFNPCARISESGEFLESTLIDIYCEKLEQREHWTSPAKIPTTEEKATSQALMEKLLQYGVRPLKITEGFLYNQVPFIPVYLRKYIYALNPYFYESDYAFRPIFKAYKTNPVTGTFPPFETLLLNHFLTNKKATTIDAIERLTCSIALRKPLNPTELTERFAIIQHFFHDPGSSWLSWLHEPGSKEAEPLRTETLGRLEYLKERSLVFDPRSPDNFECYQKAYGDQSPEAVTAEIMKCWESAKNHPLRNGWPQVVQQAQESIERISKTIDSHQKKTSFLQPMAADIVLSFITDYLMLRTLH